MILDVPIPGLEPWEQVKADPAVWHFGFQREPIDVPIVLAGGERSQASLNPTVAESLRNHGWRNVSIEVIASV